MKKSASNTFWKKQRVLVTGGSGFLGSFVVDQLREKGAADIFSPRHRDYDLRERSAIDRLLSQTRPTMIIHLAARCGGIAANQASPGEFFYDNAIMGIQLMEQARRAGVKKFVQVGTVCAYPKFTPVPFREKDLWDGYPEETNAPYGIAKKMLLIQAQAYRQQYGFNAIYLLPANLYGPRDHFDLQNSHVIPALINKILNAKETGKPSVPVWGNGKPTREFLYVEDAARGIIAAAESYNDGAPVNLGTGHTISIKDLIHTITKIIDYKGKIAWDNVAWKNGQMKRMLDTSLAKKAFGFKATTPFEQGLRNTIAWYLENRTGEGVSTPAIAKNVPSTPEIHKNPHTGEILAIVVRDGFVGKKYNFFTTPDQPLQMGINHYEGGEKIQPHVHVKQTKRIDRLQEILYIKKGHLVMHLLDSDRRFISKIDLFGGDLIFQAGGGHGFEVIGDTDIVEIKQGPFSGESDKIRFDFKDVLSSLS